MWIFVVNIFSESFISETLNDIQKTVLLYMMLVLKHKSRYHLFTYTFKPAETETVDSVKHNIFH